MLDAYDAFESPKLPQSYILVLHVEMRELASLQGWKDKGFLQQTFALNVYGRCVHLPSWMTSPLGCMQPTEESPSALECQ